MLMMFPLIPILCGIVCLFLKGAWLRLTLVGCAVLHLVLTLGALFYPFTSPCGCLELDSPSRVFLPALSVLFLLVSLYSRDYMSLNSREAKQEAHYSCCLLWMFGFMSASVLSRHLGVTWALMTGAVLSGGPLIGYHGTSEARAAAWKYLIMCLSGLGLVLAGNLLLTVSFGEPGSPALMENLLKIKTDGELKWLKAAYLCILVGYGTIMGLAPMHTWLPDACAEAPSPVAALFPALMNCAYLGILRTGVMFGAAGLADYRQGLLLFFGLGSMLFAAVSIIGQKDYSRMLAYSSTCGAGWMVLGAGGGPIGMLGALLYMFCHSMIKGMLFMLCGNIIAVYRSRLVAKVGGLLQVAPSTGVLWLAGFIALSGLPPFGIFQGNIRICRGLVESGSYLVLGGGLVLAAAVFVGSLLIFVPMAFDTPPEGMSLKPGNPLLKNLLGPAAMGGVLALVPGVYVPQWLEQLLRESAAFFSG